MLLKTLDGNKFLPIWIGHPEAAAILVKLQGSPTPRPMTHDLVADMLGELNAQVTKIAVTELRESTFYAVITLQVNGSEIDDRLAAVGCAGAGRAHQRADLRGRPGDRRLGHRVRRRAGG